MLFRLLLICALFVSLLPGQSLDAPAQANAGAEVTIGFSGAAGARDFITIVPAGEAEGKYGAYKYTSAGAPAKLLAPERAGDYEIRWLGEGNGHPTVARRPIKVLPVSATLDAPSQLVAGNKIEVRWTGPNNPRDFVTIVPKGSPEKKYGKYAYTERGNPAQLAVPDRPGEYEIRYLTGKDHLTLASLPLLADAATATIEAPSSSAAGAVVPIRWTGPNNERDFVTIVAADAAEKKYGKYVYTDKGSPMELPAPDDPGAYEIRYLTGVDHLTLAAHPLTVGAVSAAIEAPSSSAAGAVIPIRWTGPNNARDFITIVPAGTEAKKYGKYVYTDKGSPTELAAPDEPGPYEIRYLTGVDHLTLASANITVGATSASLDAAAEIVGGRVPFPVSWTGPDNRGDFITIVKKGEADRKYGNYAYTYRGSPATVLSPNEPGEYELRYLTGQDHRTLAARPILVTPGAGAPGVLRVISKSSGSTAAPEAAAAPSGGAVEIILDASGSMLQRQGSERRIEIAKRTLIALTQDVIPAGTPFALRVFGHKEAGACRSDLEMAAAPLDPSQAAATIGSIQAMNLAKTPIAESLAAVLQDLRGHTGEKVIVLVTDGEETCDGEPAETIEAMRSAGFDVRVNIVGFAIDDETLKGKFRYWAEIGGGGYFDAADADQLGAALTQAVHAGFDVYDSNGQVIATGVVGGADVEVPAGVYVVRTRTSPARTAPGVEVRSGETTTVGLE